MRKWVRVGLVGCTMAGVLASGAALADDYPDGVEASAPAAMRAFQAIVPARYRKAAWVYRFNGTASPMQTVQFGGLPFWLGEVCKPHDCGGNEVTFLIAKDGSAAYGLLRSVQLTRSQITTFGNPNPAARKLLEGQFQAQ